MPNEKDVYSVTQLAKLAKVTRQAVALACREKRIEGAYRLLGRWIIPKSGGDKYIEAIKKSDS